MNNAGLRQVILEYIKDYYKKYAVPPTMRSIVAQFADRGLTVEVFLIIFHELGKSHEEVICREAGIPYFSRCS